MSTDTVGILQRGVTLIELILFIVIVSVGVAGLVSVIGPMVRSSADPMVTKQLAAIAESLLNEALHQPFSWCDPDDANASKAKSYADCINPQSTLGAVPNSELPRAVLPGNTYDPYDNVADYGSFNLNDISDAAGNFVIAGYSAVIAVAHVGNAFGLPDNTAALSIAVTVTHNGEMFTLTGYRFRYAPRI